MAYWKDPSVIESWLWIGLCIIILFITTIIWITQNYISNIKKEKDKRKRIQTEAKHSQLVSGITAQENERKRIATNLHDHLISQLNLIRLSDPTVLSSETLSNKIKNCMGIVRNISHDLLPPFIQHMSLREIIQDHCDSLPNNYNIDFSYSEVKIKFQPFEKLQLLRIIQEVTTNIFKHANATKIQILVRVTNMGLALRIKDNGIGIKDDTRKGMGFQSIDARARVLKAKYKYYSQGTSGTTFILQIKKNINYGGNY